ncbi:MAG: sensor histidine kinase [Bacilli bacterium]|jgi:two-component system sensor histidine kinase YesM|nr:sensor histidine kinase [Bacilli bacterium]
MSTERKHKYFPIQQLVFYPVIGMFFIFIIVLYFLISSIFNQYANAQADTTVKTLSKQVLANYDTYFESVIKVSDSIQTEINYMDLASQASEVSSYFDKIMSLQGEIYNMAIYSSSGTLLVKDKDYQPIISDNSKEIWFVRAMNEPLVNVFSPITGISSSEQRFTVSKHVFYNKEKDEGVLKMEYSFNKIVSLIADTDLGNGGNIYISDKNGQTVYSSAEISDNEKKLASELVFGSSSYISNGSYFLLYVSTIQNTTWRVAIAINNDSLHQAIRQFTIVLTICSAVEMLIFALITSFVSRKISKPINQLQTNMVKVETLNYSVLKSTPIEEKSFMSKEVHDLNNSFDQMMKRIDELNKANIKEEEEKRKSELKALQNQINPHFLYNTMDSIIYLIEKGENEKAEEMIMALSKFFRISISRGKNIIPLASEIEHAKNYLIIQKIRYGEAFDYQIVTQPGLEKYFVIKLILQPIVENAIIHGIEENTEKSANISISERVENGFIYLEVTDSGYGILPEKVQEIYASFKDESAHSGVGLKNVYQRLKIYYGEEADLKIDSKLDQGSKITIIIPEKGALKDEE